MPPPPLISPKPLVGVAKLLMPGVPVPLVMTIWPTPWPKSRGRGGGGADLGEIARRQRAESRSAHRPAGAHGVERQAAGDRLR